MQYYIPLIQLTKEYKYKFLRYLALIIFRYFLIHDRKFVKPVENRCSSMKIPSFEDREKKKKIKFHNKQHETKARER